MASNLLRLRQLTCTVYLFLLEIAIVEAAWLNIVSGEPGRLFLCLLGLAVDLVVAVLDIGGGDWGVASRGRCLVLVVSRRAVVLEL